MKYLLSIACLGLLGTVASIGSAQEKKGSPPAAGQGQPGADAMAMMMEAFAKIAAPGPHHEHLEALQGAWSVAGKFRMTPDQPWEEQNSEGKSELVLGGRFLHQHYEGGPMMGMPEAFEGLGFIGYDNQKQKYVYAWIDSMGTMIMIGEGTCDAAGKTITFRSDFVSPFTNQKTYMTSVYKVEGPDRYVHSMFGPGPDGKDFQMVELVHTRKK